MCNVYKIHGPFVTSNLKCNNCFIFFFIPEDKFINLGQTKDDKFERALSY